MASTSAPKPVRMRAGSVASPALRIAAETRRIGWRHLSNHREHEEGSCRRVRADERLEREREAALITQPVGSATKPLSLVEEAAAAKRGEDEWKAVAGILAAELRSQIDGRPLGSLRRCPRQTARGRPDPASAIRPQRGCARNRRAPFRRSGRRQDRGGSRSIWPPHHHRRARCRTRTRRAPGT